MKRYFLCRNTNRHFCALNRTFATHSEARAPALKDASLFRTQSYIGGKWCDANSGKRFSVIDPATGKHVESVPDMDSTDVQKAVDAAQEGFEVWRCVSAKERSRKIYQVYQLMLENSEDLAQILTSECGKPIVEARGEILYGASFFEWFSAEARRTYGTVIPEPSSDRRLFAVNQPVGICGIITPWNFPNAMITRKCGAALAAGCSMIVKPAEQTPFSALALSELMERAGIPAGVFNVVTCSGKNAPLIGKEFCKNPLIRKISFTGSTNVGKLLLRDSSDSVKRVSLELGGNAPFVVFEDADLDLAVRAAMGSKFRYSGQTCVCANRFIVHESVVKDFTFKLVESVKKLKVGSGFQESVNQGPLIDQSAFDRMNFMVSDASSKGARIHVGGKPHPLGGFFYEPTVLSECDASMEVAQREIFGPIAPIFSFQSEQEALRIANDTCSGLAGYLMTNSASRQWRFAEKLQVGMVGINEALISSESAPFGGFKESGLGREGSFCGIDEYLELKYICLGGFP